jgi:hypothetical protein
MTAAGSPTVLVLAGSDPAGLADEASAAAAAAGVRLVPVMNGTLPAGDGPVGLLAHGEGVLRALHAAAADPDRVWAVSILGPVPALDAVRFEDVRAPIAIWVDHGADAAGLPLGLRGGTDIHLLRGRSTTAVYDAALRFCAPS